MNIDINDQQLIDAIPVSIHLKDPQGIYLICNQYMLNMAGLTSCQIIGKTDYELPWSAQANKIRVIDRAVITEEKVFQIEEQPETYSGSYKTFLSTKSPFRDSYNRVTGILCISIDITEQKNLREMLALTEKSLEKSDTIKERFLRNLSHEIKDPLQGVLGTAQFLSWNWGKLNEAKCKTLVDSIVFSGRRLATFVINTFDLSDLIRRDKNLNIGIFNFSRVVETIVADFNELSKLDKKAHIMFKSNKDYFLAFDYDMIARVLGNILMNSLKWTQSDGMITVTISKAKFPHSDEIGIQCSIADTGIGIPKEDLEFIFEPFAESSRTASKACGTGLGLALCREIIKIHGGVIWASSDVKQGSVINFSLPNSTSKNNLYH